MTAVRRESFDGGEIAPGRGRARDLARSHRLAVRQHRAGTANTHTAAKLCPGQSQRVSQDPEQRRVVVYLNDMLRAVDG